MSDPASLVRWRRADTDPPTGVMGRQVLTLRDDGSVAACMAVIVTEGYVPIVSWAELPTPPGDDALTVKHLRELDEGFNALIADDDAAVAHWSPTLARLRAALDALQSTP